MQPLLSVPRLLRSLLRGERFHNLRNIVVAVVSLGMMVVLDHYPLPLHFQARWFLVIVFTALTTFLSLVVIDFADQLYDAHIALRLKEQAQINRYANICNVVIIAALTGFFTCLGAFVGSWWQPLLPAAICVAIYFAAQSLRNKEIKRRIPKNREVHA